MSLKPTPIFRIERESTKSTSEEASGEIKRRKRIPAKHYRVTTDYERANIVQLILRGGFSIKEVKIKL
jgi:hypothetical protein